MGGVNSPLWNASRNIWQHHQFHPWETDHFSPCLPFLLTFHSPQVSTTLTRPSEMTKINWNPRKFQFWNDFLKAIFLLSVFSIFWFSFFLLKMEGLDDSAAAVQFTLKTLPVETLLLLRLVIKRIAVKTKGAAVEFSLWILDFWIVFALLFLTLNRQESLTQTQWNVW